MPDPVPAERKIGRQSSEVNIGTFIRIVSALLITASTAAASGDAVPGTVEDILGRGRALTGERRYEEAGKLLEEALRAEPSSGELKKGLAKVWAGRAHFNLGEGNLYRALTWAERAVQLLPGEVDHHFLLGVILMRKSDYYYARQVFEEVLEIDPGNAAARDLLGDIYYRQGVIDEAIVQWERVLESTGDHRPVRRKIAKGAREIEIEEDFGREVSRNFTLLFDGPVPPAVIRYVLGSLEESYRVLAGKLGTSPSGDIIVILYGREDFHGLTGRPRWVGGLFDGKIRIPAGGLETEEEAAGLEPVLRHELVHSFLRSMVGRGLPLWFEEGLAEHFERGAAEGYHLPPEVLHQWEFDSFEEVDRALRGWKGSVELAYIAALQAVETLLSERGLRAVVDTIDEVGAGTEFPRALEEEAGLTVGELHDLLTARWSTGGDD